MTAVLLPVDTLSGEIASGVVQTLASKPVRRSTIVLGKWIAFSLVVVGYLAVVAGGVLLIARVLGARLKASEHRQIDHFDDVTAARVSSLSAGPAGEPRPFPVQVDGDYIGDHTELELRVHPGALRVVA